MISSATTRVPVEIWWRILKFAISIPLFLDSGSIEPFDADGDTIHQYYWELPYWSTERHRNSFRRVCTSWNEYLRPFNHRYIRFTDIIHGTVPMNAFPRAIRLYVGLCMCKECHRNLPEYLQEDSHLFSLWRGRPEQYAKAVRDSIHLGRLEFFESLFAQYGRHSKLEVLHVDTSMGEDVALASRAVTLRSVIGLSFNSLIRLKGLISLQNLRV